MSTSDQTSKPAIVWTVQSGSAESSSNEYWDLLFLEEGTSSVSYNELHRLARVLSRQIRYLISSVFENVHVLPKAFLVQVPVAVAIPEGPLLPISIAALHALNEPFEINGSERRKFSVVLMPLDPCDGFERLRNMLEDARPTLVLTASDSDQQRLQKVADRMAAPTNNACDSPIYQSLPTKLVDVREMLREDGRVPVDCCVADSTSSTTSSPDGRVSHLVFTSGTTGRPKGCLSSIKSLRNYVYAKNRTHGITFDSVVFLASSISFDPCLSDILATFQAEATLAITRRSELIQNLGATIQNLSVSHVLCTPSLWSAVERNEFDFRRLQVIALGGEKIPGRMVQNWARSSLQETQKEEFGSKLFATFGVTEACVYQTFGEVFRYESLPGQNVGRPFEGMVVRICDETNQQDLVDVSNCGYPEGVGEVVLTGNQLDDVSSYLLRPQLTASKFMRGGSDCLYRTGDRGYLEPETERLFILGRIGGEEGMVKLNGVRCELGEIESALVDVSDEYAIVTDSSVVASNTEETSTTSEIVAYIVLSAIALAELGIPTPVPEAGLLCNDETLLSLLRDRCRANTRVVPSLFIAIPRIPMTSTGKRNRRGVPAVLSATPMLSTDGIPLKEYGRTGELLAAEITECLNLVPEHASLMVTTATFAMLGGDSLTATRIVRALYAKHHSIFNSRHLGGKFGTLDGPFNVVHFLNAENLGRYVDWLDEYGVCAGDDGDERPDLEPATLKTLETVGSDLYKALLTAIVSNYTCVAMAILERGVDPNKMEHGGRIGKTSGRMERRQLFRSGPLHLACFQGNPVLVKNLLDRGVRYNTPDAAGLFPIHLAAIGPASTIMRRKEQLKRLECIKFLLAAGVPVTILDGSKQSIVHAAARAGNTAVLEYILEIDRAGLVGWRDTWSRTAVHWAVLNGHVSALKLLLNNKGDADPKPMKKTRKRSSVAQEQPLEICRRVHGNTVKGARMQGLLEDAMKKSTSH